MDVNSQEAKELVEFIRKENNQSIPAQIPEWSSATVVSSSGGSAIINLPTDNPPVNITVQNPREISLEVGDEVSILKFGSLTNSIVDFRKDIVVDNIYVDFLTGIDDYKHGTEFAPFKTLQYAINRLQKNINGRTITIYYKTLNSEDIVINSFYGSGYLNIFPYSGTDVTYISSIRIDGCQSVNIELGYLGCSSYLVTDGGVSTSVYVKTSNFVTIRNFSSIFNNTAIFGIIAGFGSSVAITESTISNKNAAIWSFSCSTVYSANNSGTGNTYGLMTSWAATLGKNSTQPSGTTAEYSTGGGIIR